MTIKTITLYITRDSNGKPMAHGGFRLQDGRRDRTVNYVIDYAFKITLWGDDKEFYEAVRPHVRKLSMVLECTGLLNMSVEEKP